MLLAHRTLRLALTGLLCWAVETPAAFAQTQVKLYPAPAGAPRSADFSVRVNGQPVDLYGSRTRYGGTATFGYFDFAGEVEVEVIEHFGPSHSAAFLVLPEKYGIKPETVANGHIRFRLTQPAKLTFVLCGDYVGNTLHLFANAPETDAPAPGAPGVIYFGPGYHEIGADQQWRVTLQSGQRVYLAGGAYVVGNLAASQAKGIRIHGRGILAQGPAQPSAHGLRFTDCEDLEVSGIILNRTRDGWSGSIHRSRGIRIHDYKVVSPAIWSTDGLNLLNCQDAVLADCFFRAGDDNIAIKGFGAAGGSRPVTEDPKAGRPNRDILIRDCIFWSDNNTAVVLGQESKAAVYENITVRDSDVLFCRDDQPYKAALAIVCLNATDYRNILFENIRVGPCGQLIAAFHCEEIFRLKGNQNWPGEINGVTYRNITATGAGSKRIRIEGWSENKKVHNVVLENVTIDGIRVREGSPYLLTNPHVEGLTFK